MKKNKKIKKIWSIWIIISLIFIIPLNFGLAFSSQSILQTSTTKGNLQTFCGGGFTDIKDSLIMSIVTMCIPGILEKVHQYKEIKCQTAVCYYDSVKNKLDPSFCIKQQAYQTCSYILGDIFALPGLNLIDKLRQYLADALANPVGLVVSLITPILRKALSSSGGNIGSLVFSIPLLIIDGASLIQQVKNIFKNGFFPSFSQKSACSRLPAIKKEMDKIIKYA